MGEFDEYNQSGDHPAKAIRGAGNMSESTSHLQPQLGASRPQWWLGAMLLALHAALAWGIDSLVSRAMLLAHFGVFLIWQPVWRGERRLDGRHALLLVRVGVLLAGWNNW